MSVSVERASRKLKEVSRLLPVFHLTELYSGKGRLTINTQNKSYYLFHQPIFSRAAASPPYGQKALGLPSLQSTARLLSTSSYDARKKVSLLGSSTPNPNSYKFSLQTPNDEYVAQFTSNSPVTAPLEFTRTKGVAKRGRSSYTSPLAAFLFAGLPDVERLMIAKDFFTVTSKDEAIDWGKAEGLIEEEVRRFYETGKDAITVKSSSAPGEDPNDADDNIETGLTKEEELQKEEVVSLILELLESKVRPYVQADGGDVEFDSFDLKSGTAYVRLVGACKSCPSSTVTMRFNIQNLLTHYIPEVKAVEPALDDDDEDIGDGRDWTG